MKKYEYENKGQRREANFIDYYFTAGSGKHFIFRVQKLDLYRKQMPMIQASSSIDCATAGAILNNDFIKDVNQFRQKTWVAEGNANQEGYTLWQVQEIISLEQSASGTIAWNDARLSFAYNGAMNSEENVSQNPDAYKVFFQQKKDRLCLNETELLVVNQLTGAPQHYYFTDNIGLTRIVKEQSESQLISINGLPLESQVARLCELKARGIDGNLSSQDKWKQGTTTPSNPNSNYPVTPTPNNPFTNNPSATTTPSTKAGANPMDLDNMRNQTEIVYIPSRPQNPTNSNGEFRGRGLNRDGQSNFASKFIIHEVKEGEGLLSIARTYNTNVETLMRLNNLPNEQLVHHQQLRVRPDWKMDTENPKIVEENGVRKVVHVVRQGDMLGRIARRYHKRTAELEQLNNLSPNAVLKIGQELIISQEWANQ